MGRSVALHPEAVVTAYAVWQEEWDEFAKRFSEDYPEMGAPREDEYAEIVHEQWLDSLEWFVERAQELWPSFEREDDWIGREVHVVLRNRYAEVSVSEYCGLTALCVAVRASAEYDGVTGLATRWIHGIENKFLAEFGQYYKLATMSNGASIYKKLED